MNLPNEKKVIINKLILQDVYEMRNWGRHKSLLFSDYNFPKMTDRQVYQWYEHKSKSSNKKCFGIRNEENKLIGYLTIRGIKRFRKIGTLGLVLDPNYMDRGYGTEVLNEFLNYFFNSLNMKKMILQVAKFNKRAMKCYQKCGFTITGEVYKVINIPKIKIEEELPVEEINKNFRIKRNRKEMGFYKMELDIRNYPIRTKRNHSNVYNFVDMWKSFRKKTQYVDNNNINNT